MAIRTALDLIVAPDHVQVPTGYAPAVEDVVAEARSWAFTDGTRGFGIARRIRSGRRTRELTLKVYVERKLPRSELRVSAPRVLRVPWSRREIAIDVEEIGKMELHNEMQRSMNPAKAGCAIANFSRTFGTLGCLVKEPDGSQLYILSAAHVIANNTFGIQGLVVVQPGVKGEPSRVIGRLQRWGELHYDNTKKTFNNLFDAAIATLIPDAALQEIHDLGRPKGYSLDVKKGDLVKKCGAATLKTEGRVVDADFSCVFDYRNPDDNQFYSAGFYRQVLCERISERGDSGAAVLDGQSRVVGLIVGGAEKRTVFSRIGPILSRLNVTIA